MDRRDWEQLRRIFFQEKQEKLARQAVNRYNVL
jgi:hypothetical protein